MNPPPELAPMLAAILHDPSDALAWSAVYDVHEELGWPCGHLAHAASHHPFRPRRGGWLCSVASMSMASWLERGPEIARWMPLTHVEITDKGPTIFNGGCWYFGKNETHVESQTLDACIFDHLSGGILKSGGEKRMYMDYPTKDDAVIALSRASILWARSAT